MGAQQPTDLLLPVVVRDGLIQYLKRRPYEEVFEAIAVLANLRPAIMEFPAAPAKLHAVTSEEA